MAVSGIASAACAGKSVFDRAELQNLSTSAAQLDQIEAAGMTLMGTRGLGGGAHFVGKRMRKAA